MDNLCHSLAGAAIAQAGFARKLPRATLLAVIAANIPDVDALVYLGSDSAFAVSFRRGWTHGLPALIVWAFALSWVFARWQQRDLRAYLPLAAIAVVSHPVLDWMNTYGVRFLMPFSDRWFYGDTLFIVDPPLLVLFGLGWFVSSRMLAAKSARAEWPARIALVLALAYVAGMKWASVATRNTAIQELSIENPSAQSLMIVPQPLSVLKREVFVRSYATYDRYRAEWDGLRPSLSATPLGGRDHIGADSALVAAVRATRDGARFLRWSRFPYFVPDSGPGARSAFVGDARYASGTIESWAGIRVLLR